MPDSIAQLIVKNYSKANINISNNTAQVSYSHLTDSAGKDFTIIIQMSEPFTPKTTLEIMNKFFLLFAFPHIPANTLLFNFHCLQNSILRTKFYVTWFFLLTEGKKNLFT